MNTCIRIDKWNLARCPAQAPDGSPPPEDLEWITSAVPGVVHYDLQAAGMLENPYGGTKAAFDAAWVAKSDWVYRGSFRAPEDYRKMRTIRLRFNGVDTFSEIWLNGTLLGETANAYRVYDFPVRPEQLLPEDMYDDPEGLHALMDWFLREHTTLIGQYRDLGLLTLNNEDDLIASGGIGCTDELPTAACRETGRVDFPDLWGFSESQETVGVSPQMFAEFVFPYQLPLLERFGINCYGCCEPVEARWEWIRTIPRLRRLSVSPWSNKEQMREILGKGYIFSRKPNPSPVCMGFDEEEIRRELSSTLALAKDTHMEIILKDTHTVENHPERLCRWVEIARELTTKSE